MLSIVGSDDGSTVANYDAKVLAVPVDSVTGIYRHIEDVGDVDPTLLAQIEHFFEHYKDLEEGKWVKIEGWGDVSDAEAEINDAITRFNDAPEKPFF
mgnify:CR=1 FL=1